MAGGLLFTGDLQADYENLDTCRLVVHQMLEYGERKKARGIVFLGDLKERYNPVDLRVVNFAVRMISRFKKRGMEVFVLLGNHDRVGMHSEEESWLTALGKAGARVFSREGMVAVGGYTLYFLPFRNGTRELRRMAASLRRMRQGRNGAGGQHVLCFHAQLEECDVVFRGPGTVSVEDLFPQEYDYVVGGHFHRHQRVKYDNVFYAGSPFATGWGEVNQTKGFLYLE